MRKRYLWTIYAIVLAGSFGSLAWLIGLEQHSKNPAYWHIAALIGSVVIAIGWIVASENTVRNAQRQHSVSISLAYEYHSGAEERRKVIREFLPKATSRLDPAKDSSLPQYSDVGHDLFAALDYELNFMDFIASGVSSETLDGGLIRDSFRTQFFFRYYQAEPYIRHIRSRNANIWKALYDLCEEWEFSTYVPIDP
jgi:hypothetical protein